MTFLNVITNAVIILIILGYALTIAPTYATKLGAELWPIMCIVL